MLSILLFALSFAPQQDKFYGSLEQNNVILSGAKDESGYFLRVGDNDPRAEKAIVTVTFLDSNKRKTREFVIVLVPDALVLTDYMPTKAQNVQSIIVEVRHGEKKIATAKWKRKRRVSLRHHRWWPELVRGSQKQQSQQHQHDL